MDTVQFLRDKLTPRWEESLTITNYDNIQRMISESIEQAIESLDLAGLESDLRRELEDSIHDAISDVAHDVARLENVVNGMEAGI